MPIATPQAALILRVGGCYPDELGPDRDGIGSVLDIVIDIALVDLWREAFRIKFLALIQRRDRLIEALQAPQRDAQIVPQVKILGVNLRPLACPAFPLLIALAPNEQGREVSIDAERCLGV